MKLYKYYSNIEYAIESIKNDEIYFSLSDSFNDIYDCKIVNAGEMLDVNLKGDIDIILVFVDKILLKCEGFFMDFFSQNKDINEMNKMFRNKVSNNKTTPQDYLKFVYNFSEQKESFESFFAMIKKSYIKRQPIISLTKRVTCFSEVNDSILMWSYYADKHQGVCLEYDPILLNDGNDEHVTILNAIQKVQYSEKQYNSVGSLNSMEDINTIFFSKALCWSHEQEWRIVLNENIEKLRFPCLTGVYLGANFDNSEKYCDIVRSVIGKDRYVALYDAVVDREEYKIRFDCRNPKK